MAIPCVLTEPITIRNARCDNRTKGAFEAAPKRVRARRQQLPRRGGCTTRPRPARAHGRVPPGRGPQTVPRAPAVPASCPGLEPFPCLPPSRQQGCPKGSGSPPGPSRRAHPRSCAASLRLSHPRRRAPRPAPEARLPPPPPNHKSHLPSPTVPTARELHPGRPSPGSLEAVGPKALGH